MSSCCHWFLLNGALITQKSWKIFYNLCLSLLPLTLTNVGKSHSSKDITLTLPLPLLLCLRFTLTVLKWKLIWWAGQQHKMLISCYWTWKPEIYKHRDSEILKTFTLRGRWWEKYTVRFIPNRKTPIVRNTEVLELLAHVMDTKVTQSQVENE